jgi:hypothetical protein
MTEQRDGTSTAGRTHSRARLAALALFLATGGCGKSENGMARYVPAEQTARQALVAGLDAWKGGAAAGEVKGTKPLVFVTDSYRRPKERLVGYEILGEVPGDVPRCYAVDLRFAPPREEKVRYVVVGIDPLWVFRQEDYQFLTHWDHHMEDASDRPPVEAPKPHPDSARHH